MPEKLCRMSCCPILLYGNSLMYLKISWSDVWESQTCRDRIRSVVLGSSILSFTHSNTPSFLTGTSWKVTYWTLKTWRISHRNGDDMFLEFELLILDFDRKISRLAFVFQSFFLRWFISRAHFINTWNKTKKLISKKLLKSRSTWWPLGHAVHTFIFIIYILCVYVMYVRLCVSLMR